MADTSEGYSKETDSKKGNPRALLPIGVFLVLYLGLGILFEYGLNIPMGFYNIPIVVIFLVALLVACIQNPRVNIDQKLAIMGRGIGDSTIITMVLIFMIAGIFVGTVGRESAESVAYFLLDLIPAQYAVVVLFIVSCIVSLSMGTSVGTITLITPIGIAVANASGFSMPLCIASVMGGAMFGDNLSFISDTTIAACQGQDVPMKDKFKENLKIALPAALATIVIILFITGNTDSSESISADYDLTRLIPYLIVLAGGIVGINVFVILILGIVTGSLIMIVACGASLSELLTNMGTGCSSMFETTMVAILVSAICALITSNGGFRALLNGIQSLFKSRKGGMLGMGLLVGAMDIATANNTVAIVVANPIAKQMAQAYKISPRKTASLLDTFSCIFQGIIPYGAQMLVAISAAAELGYAINAFEIMPFLFYPFMLLLSSLLFIFVFSSKPSRTNEPDTR